MEAQDTILSLKSTCPREPSRDSVMKPCSRAVTLCNLAGGDALQRTLHSRSHRSTSEGNDQDCPSVFAQHAPALEYGFADAVSLVLRRNGQYAGRWFFDR